MGWFARRGKAAADNASALQLQQAEQRVRVLQRAVKSLLEVARRLSVEEEALATPAFRSRIEAIERCLENEADVAAFADRWPADAEALADYSRRQQRYLKEREAELRQIIGLLGSAMAENETFNRKVFEQSERIEGLIGLDDIREIKSALEQEAAKMKRAVAEKRSRDAERADVLDAEVRHLKEELKKALMDGLRDGLTGLYNRQALQRYLDALLGRPEEAGRPASLLLVDIDDFSKFETVYSTKLRDRVALAIADQCREFAAHTDFLARYADGVFAVALPAVPLPEALAKADYLCRTISATRYAVGEVHDGHQLTFTVSIGVGAKRSGDTPAALLERTQRALSMAKALGRNRAVAQRSGPFSGLRARIGLP
jgi:diguanylate cyclase